MNSKKIIIISFIALFVGCFAVAGIYAGFHSTLNAVSGTTVADAPVTNDSSNLNTDSTTNTPAPTVPSRTVLGTATNLGAGTFTGGTDIPAGLYDVTAVSGSGNLTVKTSDGSLLTNEILGISDGTGVSEVRVVIDPNCQIEIQGLDQVHFEPVATDYVTTYGSATLYPGIFTVNQDIGAGRYVVSVSSGGGNLAIYDAQGNLTTNEILGTDGVSQVTVDLVDGGIIHIQGVEGVLFTPTN